MRGLRARPGFAVLAVLTLALGSGATTTIFSVIQNVLLDPFPYIDADRVAMIQIFEIIGVIADAKNRGIQEPPMPEAFVPYTLTGA